MNLLYYYVEKNRYTIKNITTNHEFPPKNLEKHTHTFKLWFSFQKKKQLLSIVLNIQRWIKHDPLLSETHSFTGKARK